MGRRFTLIHLLFVIAAVAVLIGWVLPPVAKVRMSASEKSASAANLLVFKAVMCAFLAGPPILARLCPLPREGTWWHPEPDRPLYSLKREWVRVQTDAQDAGAFFWPAVVAIVAGMLSLPSD
jgi:hypothetical protein